MLRKEQNDLLTQTGPQTPMGRLFRCYWTPALLAEELPDENCWAWSYDYHPTRAITEADGRVMQGGKGIHCKYVPGSFRPLANKDNDYLIDREHPAARRQLQRRRRHRYSGWVAAGEHGANRRSHKRKRHHHGATSSDAGCTGIV